MPHAAGIINWVALLAFTASSLAAALSDVARFLIPNRYPAAIAIAFLIYAIDKPMAFWINGFLAGALFLAIGIVLFERGAIGGGDVKLLTASALWAGFDQFALLVFVTALGGGVLALAQLLPLHRLAPARTDAASNAPDLRSKLRQPVPFGVAIACGAVSVALSRLAT
jgi:prepilin peptidase CpaA